jgi:hypothetical protein
MPRRRARAGRGGNRSHADPIAGRLLGRLDLQALFACERIPNDVASVYRLHRAILEAARRNPKVSTLNPNGSLIFGRWSCAPIRVTGCERLSAQTILLGNQTCARTLDDGGTMES